MFQKSTVQLYKKAKLETVLKNTEEKVLSAKLIICTMPMQSMILKPNLDQNQMIFRSVSFYLLSFLACF